MGRRYSVPRGRDGWPVRGWVDPGLRGRVAWFHPSVVGWRRWVREELVVGGVLLVTPCSNVKPYPRSPVSGKVRGVLRRLGLWDDGGGGLYGGPVGLEWFYLSDLLGFVPYVKSHLYPACCYEFPPGLLDDGMAGELRGVLRGFFVRNRGVRVVLFLPRFYLGLVVPVLEEVGVSFVRARYHLFYGQRDLERVLRGVLGV